MQKCELCEIPSDNLTKHHLIPRTLHANKWFKQRFTREELHDGIMVDRPCHSHIHKSFNNKDLGKRLNTLEALKKEEAIIAYVSWKQKRYNKHGYK